MTTRSRVFSWAFLATILGIVFCDIADAQNRRRQRQRPQDKNALKVGQLAPTFKLKSLDGKESFALKDLRGDKPVVLFFGSYT